MKLLTLIVVCTINLSSLVYSVPFATLHTSITKGQFMVLQQQLKEYGLHRLTPAMKDQLLACAQEQDKLFVQSLLYPLQKPTIHTTSQQSPEPLEQLHTFHRSFFRHNCIFGVLLLVHLWQQHHTTQNCSLLQKLHYQIEISRTAYAYQTIVFTFLLGKICGITKEHIKQSQADLLYLEKLLKKLQQEYVAKKRKIFFTY